ncbi:MAG: hypothetical protein ACP5HQ_06965 [Thermoprotei archaeon]
MPSWYAGEISGNYYFFVNLLDFPSKYESLFGGACAYLPVFVGFTDRDLYSILNGTVGGDPIAINPRDPGSVVKYDNGPNVFPIYVNLYRYSSVNDFVGGQYDVSKKTYNLYYQNYWQQDGILPTYNPWRLYHPSYQYDTGDWINYNGPMWGLPMINGNNQGNYILITSELLDRSFKRSIFNQNGNGLNIFVYFSGIPWYDSPGTGSSPLVADAVAISYVVGNPGVAAANNIFGTGKGIGGNTPLPLNYASTMFEYGWKSCGGGEPGCSSGYYVGIPININCALYTQGISSGWVSLPSILLDVTESNLKSVSKDCRVDTDSTANSHIPRKFYYAGSGGGGSNYYFGTNDNYANNNNGEYIPFAPLDQQNNNNYLYYGVFYTYWWFSTDSSNNLNVYFLVNGNIYNQSLPKDQYQFGGFLSSYSAQAIKPQPPYTYIAQSYENAYETAFLITNTSLNKYHSITYPSSNFPSSFINGTFRYAEAYKDNNGNIYTIQNPLVENINYYQQGQPYVFISAGSGGGSGYMYLDWVIGTFGVPYEITIP